MNEDKKEKMLNLLADQALFGLTETELAELENLEKEFPELKDDNSFELTAAAINLTNLEINEPLPAHLQARILESAEEFFATDKTEQNVYQEEAQSRAKGATATTEAPTRVPWWNWLGWGVAVAACIALAVNVSLTRFAPNERVENKTVTQTPIPELSIQQKREQLLASAKDVVQTSWAEVNPKKPLNISGDIVWSNSEQKGYMRFRGLPANDPNRETYQLWIFDEAQDMATPIDGGVFNVNENGEVIIPINAKLPVSKPLQFAVTAEKPGGVVVSKREKIMTIAKV